MLDIEFKYFLDNQTKLVNKYHNKFLVIKNQKVVKVYNDYMEAYSNSEKKYGLGNFLIQHCLPGELSTTRTFHSQITF